MATYSLPGLLFSNNLASLFIFITTVFSVVDVKFKQVETFGKELTVTNALPLIDPEQLLSLTETRE